MQASCVRQCRPDPAAQLTIHDALFKATFTQPEHAAGELRHVLPADFVKMLDFATLAVEPGSYIDEALKERQSDVLLSIRTGATRTLVYVLYEHQSTWPSACCDTWSVSGSAG